MYSVKPKIVVKGLYKVFGKKPEEVFPLIKEGLSRKERMCKTKLVVALRGMEFEPYLKGIFVLVGLSGSGKSTLLRSIDHLMGTTLGEVYVNWLSVYSRSFRELSGLRRKVFGGVFQRFALLLHTAVLENMTFGLDLHGFSSEVCVEKAKSARKVMGLEGWEKIYAVLVIADVDRSTALWVESVTKPVDNTLANDADQLAVFDEMLSMEMGYGFVASSGKFEGPIKRVGASFLP